jgi:hypothetical protein
MYDDEGGDTMLRRVLFMCGMAAVLLYVLAVILGGILRPGYSHLSMAVSELIESGAPNMLLLDVIFIVYNVLLMVFAWAVGMSTRGEGLRLITAGSIILGVVGLLGLALIAFFPMDPRGAAPTIQGTGHLFLAGALSIGSILTVFFLGVGSKVRDGFWFYSLASGILVLVAGGFAAALAAQGSPFLGLAERLTIGLFLQWIFVFSAKLMREDSGRAGT